MVEGPVETHLVVAESEGPCEERHWVLQGKEAEQETEKSSRNAAVKIPHASFGFPSGCFAQINETTKCSDLNIGIRDRSQNRPWGRRHVTSCGHTEGRIVQWGN